MTTTVVIPASIISTRIPRNPLENLVDQDNSIGALQRTWNMVCSVQEVDSVYIASDDDQIADAAIGFGAKVIKTSKNCNSETDMCADALGQMEVEPDLIVNFQGDPLLSLAWIIPKLVSEFELTPTIQVATPVLRCNYQTYQNLIKNRKNGTTRGTSVVMNKQKEAMYFSKELLPYFSSTLVDGDEIPIYLHVDIYAYRPNALRKFASTTRGILERIENLEQLRFLEQGTSIKCVEVEGCAHDLVS